MQHLRLYDYIESDCSTVVSFKIHTNRDQCTYETRRVRSLGLPVVNRLEDPPDKRM